MTFTDQFVDQLHNDEKLHAGDKIFSPNRALELTMQGDGNLVRGNGPGMVLKSRGVLDTKGTTMK